MWREKTSHRSRTEQSRSQVTLKNPRWGLVWRGQPTDKLHERVNFAALKLLCPLARSVGDHRPRSKVVIERSALHRLHTHLKWSSARLDVAQSQVFCGTRLACYLKWLSTSRVHISCIIYTRHTLKPTAVHWLRVPEPRAAGWEQHSVSQCYRLVGAKVLTLTCNTW